MRDGEHGAVRELRPDGGLDQVIRLQVDGGRGLVQDQNAGVPQEGAGQAHQLPLADAGEEKYVKNLSIFS